MGRLILAPMEGLADCVLRDALTRIGGFDEAVSEFIRVSGSVLPERSFRRFCPELANGARTPAGTPLVVQLLGSDPHWLALNAERLSSLAPAGIDLNFGCPAPTVNRHGGGAMLLDDPPLIARIVGAVRAAVPPEIPVSAKMRLGVRDASRALECAAAIADAGAARLVVHARTKLDGYAPPAHWHWIARIREAVGARLPVVANGEVWNVADYLRIRTETGCEDVMLGRGAVADPWLARRIVACSGGRALGVPEDGEWAALLPYLVHFWASVQARVEARFVPGRLKLWLNALRRAYPEAEALYQAVRPLPGAVEVETVLRRAAEASASAAAGARR